MESRGDDMNEQDSHERKKRSLAQAIFSNLPTLLVLGGIAAVGFWGHHTGWKAAKFSELFGSAKPKEEEDWCTIHNVPDSKCIACHPELAGETAADWCKEHGVPESRCTVCHPEILKTGIAGDWCKEHGLPESGCTLCHPEIARPGNLASGESSVTVSKETASVKDPSTCQKHASKVQFASAQSVQKAGVHLGQVVERPMSDSVVANAEIDYDRIRFAKLASRVSGAAWRIEQEQGATVKSGDVLALIDSAEVGRAKAEYLQALAAVEVSGKTAARVQASSAAGFRTEAERFEAEAAAREAEIRLFNARQALVNLGFVLPAESPTKESIVTFGLPESILSSLAKDATPATLIPIIAPFDGIVVSRKVVAGEIVEPSEILFEVADVRRMWVIMDIPQSDTHRIALGREVVFRPDDARDEAVKGSVTWISTAVDEMTRTVKIRAEVSTPEGALKAHTFGRAQVVVRTSERAIAVPHEAVQWEGCCYVVFVRLSDEIFQTRKVRLGAKDGAYTEILAGVLPGEIVVTRGSYVLKSEILKSNLGAGCTDE